jgi:hypothetical protein
LIRVGLLKSQFHILKIKFFEPNSLKFLIKSGPLIALLGLTLEKSGPTLRTYSTQKNKRGEEGALKLSSPLLYLDLERTNFIHLKGREANSFISPL